MVSTSVPRKRELALLTTFLGWCKSLPHMLYEVRTIPGILSAVWITGPEMGAQGLHSIKEVIQGATITGLHSVCTLKEGASLPKRQYPEQLEPESLYWAREVNLRYSLG